MYLFMTAYSWNFIVFHLDLASFTPGQCTTATFCSYLAECQPNINICFGLKICLMLSPFRRAKRILKLQFLQAPSRIFSLSRTSHGDEGVPETRIPGLVGTRAQLLVDDCGFEGFVICSCSSVGLGTLLNL